MFTIQQYCEGCEGELHIDREAVLIGGTGTYCKEYRKALGCVD
jgi:hypothetical protein